MYSDLTFWLYVMIAAVSGYGTILFGYWIIMNKFKASAVFTYVLIWLAGTAFNSVTNCYSRMLTLTDLAEFHEFTQTFWWPARKITVLLILVVFLVHMTIRFWGSTHDRRAN